MTRVPLVISKGMLSLAARRGCGRIGEAMWRPVFARGIKFNAKDYPPSPGFKVYSGDLENAIAAQIKSLPDPSKLYQNADGTPKSPADIELKGAAALGALFDVSRASLLDRFKLSSEQALTLNENSAHLENFFLNGRRILDKIPVEDPATGEVTWTVVRENQKEGWEPIMYYGYVPGLLIALVFYFFLDKGSLSDWALEELRLRALEKFGDKGDNDVKLSAEEKKERDELVVERILSGDYDRLAGLRKAGSELPSSLL